MLRRIFVIFGILLSSCGSAPKVSPCLYRFESGGCFYAPLGSDEVLLRTNQEMDKNVCFTPDESQRLIEWIKRHGGNKVSSAVKPYENEMKMVMEKTNGIDDTKQGI